MVTRAPLRRWGTQTLLPRACHKGRRAGEELATPGSPTFPGALTLTVSRHGRVRGCGAVARGWGTHAAPGRARSRQAPRARGLATRTDAPAARPRRAAPLPVVAPAGVPTPQPSPASRQPGLPYPAHPAAASLPKTKQPATWPTPLQIPCPPYSPAAHLFSCLASFNSSGPGASFQQGRP